MSMKNPPTPAGIEPATFRFVAQHLNHCATAEKTVTYVFDITVWSIHNGTVTVYTHKSVSRETAHRKSAIKRRRLPACHWVSALPDVLAVLYLLLLDGETPTGCFKVLITKLLGFLPNKFCYVRVVWPCIFIMK